MFIITFSGKKFPGFYIKEHFLEPHITIKKQVKNTEIDLI